MRSNFRSPDGEGGRVETPGREDPKRESQRQPREPNAWEALEEPCGGGAD